MASTSPPGSEVSAPAEKEASGKGHGTLEILEIVEALKDAGISSCIVGISALMYYGARRVRNDWDICVPTNQFAEAISLLESKTYSAICQDAPRQSRPEISLFDTYPRFKCVGVKDVFFHVVSTQAANLHGLPSNFARSHSGLPYPPLPIFIQSLMDSRDRMALTDAIDGMDLSEGWGSIHLNLSYTDDARWAKWANERLEQAKGTANVAKFATIALDRKEFWQKIVKGKQRRGGWKYPKEEYATRFRRIGSGDPTQRQRAHV